MTILRVCKISIQKFFVFCITQQKEPANFGDPHFLSFVCSLEYKEFHIEILDTHNIHHWLYRFFSVFSTLKYVFQKFHNKGLTGTIDPKQKHSQPQLQERKACATEKKTRKKQIEAQSEFLQLEGIKDCIPMRSASIHYEAKLYTQQGYEPTLTSSSDQTRQLYLSAYRKPTSSGRHLVA